MNDRIYLDSYAMVGRRGPKDVETRYETEAHLDEMAWAGVHGALVAHWSGKEYDCRPGDGVDRSRCRSYYGG